MLVYFDTIMAIIDHILPNLVVVKIHGGYERGSSGSCATTWDSRNKPAWLVADLRCDTAQRRRGEQIALGVCSAARQEITPTTSHALEVAALEGPSLSGGVALYCVPSQQRIQDGMAI